MIYIGHRGEILEVGKYCHVIGLFGISAVTIAVTISDSFSV